MVELSEIRKQLDENVKTNITLYIEPVGRTGKRGRIVILGPESNEIKSILGRWVAIIPYKEKTIAIVNLEHLSGYDVETAETKYNPYQKKLWFMFSAKKVFGEDVKEGEYPMRIKEKIEDEGKDVGYILRFINKSPI